MLKHLRKLLLAVMICSFMTCTFLALNKIDAEENTVLGPNLMTNGSFENQINTPGGENEYELQWGAKVYTATDENDPRVRTGSKSIQLENTVGQENVPFARTTTLNEKITANSEYVLSMYVKAIGYRGYQYLQVFYNQQAARVDEQDIHFANNVSDEEGEWVKISYRFTLNETFGDGTATTAVRFSFFGGQVTQSGSLFIDDISLNKVVDPSEVEAEIFIDVDTTSQNIGYGLEIVMPKATASFIDENGISTDISDKVRGTLKSLSYDKIIEGYNDVLANEAGRTFAPAEHGYYSYTYTVEEGGLTSSATITLSVMDTLQEVRITNTDGISVKKGQEPDWSILNVEKKCSYSQWQTATSSEYEIDTGSFDKDVAGTYTIKVTMKANYYQHEVVVYDTIDVTVTDGDIDHTAVSLNLVDAENQISNVGFGLETTIPQVTATATDRQGETSDVTNTVKVTLQHGIADGSSMTWTSLPGCDNVPYAELRSFTPDDHGYYRIVYTVEYEGKTDSKQVRMNIADTLRSFSVNERQKRIQVEVGSELDLSRLKATKNMSYSGDIPVAASEIVIENYGDFDKDRLGTYTVTLAVKTTYYQKEVVATDTIEVNVVPVGEADPSDAVITVAAEDNKALIGFGLSFVFPDATAKGYNKDGDEADITSQIKITMQYGLSDGTTTIYSDIEGLTNLDLNETNRTLVPDMHGYYRLKYEVTYSGKTATEYYYADIANTLQSAEISSLSQVKVKVHKGETPMLNNLVVTAVYSYTGKKNLAPEDYRVDFGSFNEQSDVGEYTATVIVEQPLTNRTITKTASFKIIVVPEDEEIDYTSVYIRTSTTVENIPNKKPYTAPDVEVIATDKDGNTVDLHDQVTVTFQQCLDTENGIWIDILGYIDLPISERTFIADMHGYCRAVYKVSYEGKEAQAIINLNIMDTLHGISVKTDNVETVITKGTDLDLRKLIVLKTMSYTGEKTVEPGAYTIDYGTFDKNVPGKYTIKIMYGEVFGGDYEAEFEVEVRDVILSFTIVAYPTRTELSYGEQIDMNGIKAEVVFETLGKQEVPVNEITVKGYSPRRVGTQTVEFYYSGVKGGEMQITVMDAFYAVVADTDNVKLVYKNGEGLDLEGLKVYKIMVSGTRIELEKGEYTVNTDEFNKNAAGTYTIKISATIDGVNKGATFEVTVEEAEGCSGAIGSPLALISGVIVLAGAMLIKKKNG